MKKNLLWMAVAIVSCGLAFTACSTEDVPSNPNSGEVVNPNEWEIDFFALSQKYADKVGLTITAAVVDNVGTTSIVDGALREPAEDGSTTASMEFPKFALQSGTSWFFYTNHGKTGLYQGNGGGRTFGVLGVKQDQVITVEVTEQPSVKIGDVELFSKSDSSYVYYANSDCDVVFNLPRYNVISKVSVKDFVGVEYTVRFVDKSGKKLKDDVKHKGEVGKPVNLLPSDIAPIDTENGRLLFLTASNSESNVVKRDGSTVITVVYREAEKYYVLLNCMSGSTLLNRYYDLEKYWFYEGDSYTIYPSRGFVKDGAVYFTPVNNNGGKYNGAEYTFPGTLTPTVSGGKTVYIGTLNYDLDENVVYYSDIERLAMPVAEGGLGQLEGTVNSWFSFSGGIFNRFSGGRGIRLDADSYVWTEPIAEGGTYTVTIYGRNDTNDAAEPPYVLGLRDAEGKITWFEGLTIPSWGGAVTGESIVEGVEIPAGSSLVIKNDDAAKQVSLDDIKVSKPAAAE
ncbi:MAG: hypothetical protein J6T44_02230 [Prevotella sp.]|nr:hypothetical protein [Prevotella sp.]